MWRRTLLTSACILALAAPPARAASVGVAAAVNQSATSLQPGRPLRTVALGDNVVTDERISTNDVGLAQLLLADGTTFTVGPKSDVVIDKFVYNPQTGDAEVAATFSRGVLRFIGGRTSKTGGATINAPFGTIGIRGGSSVITVLPPGSQGELPTQRVDCAIGTCELNGSQFPAGQSATIGPDGGVSIFPTPAAALAANNDNLTSPGSGGSTADKGEVEAGVGSVSEENSGQAPDNADIDTAQTDGTTTDEDDTVADANQDTVRDDVAEEVDNPPPAGETRSVRVLTAGATYVVSDGDTVEDPGEVGLVGGSPEADQSVALTVDRSMATATGTGELLQGEFTLPVFDDATSQSHVLNGWDSPFGDLNGVAYTGPGQFTAYVLHVGDDATQPFYAITGTPSDLSPLLHNDDPGMREYAFTEDPIQNLPVPFTMGGGQDFAGAAITPFILLEQSTSSGVDPIMFEAFLSIQGQGTAQQSAAGVELGAVHEDESGAMIWDIGRRGSIRNDSMAQSYTSRGGAGTVSGPDGGDHFFGPNGENFVVSTQIAINDSMNDVPISREAPFSTNFSTLHVATLESETALATMTRTLTTLNGYSAGVLEGATFSDGNVPFAPVPVMNDIGSYGIRMEFVAETNTLGAAISARETISSQNADVDSIDTAVGFGIEGNESGGGSAYVDDTIFVARQNSNKDTNFLRDNDGNELRQVSNQNTASYLMSSATAPQSGFMSPGSQICECEFIKWGWWGAEVQSASAESETDERVRAGVHLGTWVAGDITDPDDLPTTATASYDGHAIGTVIAEQEGGGKAQYIAGGSMHMDWDFGARSGRVDITNFDNDPSTLQDDHAFGADVQDPYNSRNDPDYDAAGFTSPTSSFTSDFTPHEGFEGTINGSFVNNGDVHAAGVIGNFGVIQGDGAWQASGTFAGQAVGN